MLMATTPIFLNLKLSDMPDDNEIMACIRSQLEMFKGVLKASMPKATVHEVTQEEAKDILRTNGNVGCGVYVADHLDIVEDRERLFKSIDLQHMLVIRTGGIPIQFPVQID